MRKILIICYFLSLCHCSSISSIDKGREPVLGDSSEFIMKHSSWGKPKEILMNESTEQWVYETSGILPFKNGLVIKMDE